VSRSRRTTGAGSWTALGLAVLGLALVAVGVSLARTAPVAAAPGLSIGRAEAGPAGPGAVPLARGAQVPVLPVVPRVLALPRQHVVALVQSVGVAAGRELDLPGDPRQVGWWAGGQPAGAASGSTVIAGHLDSARSGIGALSALLSVKAGDPVEVSAGGMVLHYRVVSRSTYRKTALPGAVFRLDGPPVLTLITCGGPYNARTHHYRDNLVVTALPRTSR
jgi:LPXTG-site transpeptidase (sortase) family protein